MEFACAFSDEEEEADVDDQEDDEARFDQCLSCILLRDGVASQVRATDDSDDKGDRGREL